MDFYDFPECKFDILPLNSHHRRKNKDVQRGTSLELSVEN